MADDFPGVSGFLSALDHGQRERFLLACEARESPLQVWLYACAMGYESDFAELESWLQRRYPQLNRRRMLEAEAVRLEADIAQLRADAGADAARPSDTARNVATLTKELRGHLTEIERMSKGLDRRGLILSGADKMLRVLQDMFSEDEDMQAALGQGFEVLWSQLNEER
ncbi:MAG: hypothetical protein ACO4CP_12030 [Steroidobacteraceae bacterium]